MIFLEPRTSSYQFEVLALKRILMMIIIANKKEDNLYRPSDTCVMRTKNNCESISSIIECRIIRYCIIQLYI